MSRPVEIMRLVALMGEVVTFLVAACVMVIISPVLIGMMAWSCWKDWLDGPASPMPCDDDDPLVAERSAEGYVWTLEGDRRRIAAWRNRHGVVLTARQHRREMIRYQAERRRLIAMHSPDVEQQEFFSQIYRNGL